MEYCPQLPVFVVVMVRVLDRKLVPAHLDTWEPIVTHLLVQLPWRQTVQVVMEEEPIVQQAEFVLVIAVSVVPLVKTITVMAWLDPLHQSVAGMVCVKEVIVVFVMMDIMELGVKHTIATTPYSTKVQCAHMEKVHVQLQIRVLAILVTMELLVPCTTVMEYFSTRQVQFALVKGPVFIQTPVIVMLLGIMDRCVTNITATV